MSWLLDSVRGLLDSPSTVRAAVLMAASAFAFSRFATRKDEYVPMLHVPSSSSTDATAATAEKLLDAITLDEREFVDLLGKFLQHAEKLQNNPLATPPLVPREDLIADLVVECLAPYTAPNGPLLVRKVTYVEGRSNVIIQYPGTTDKWISFVGSHMDVVPALTHEWKVDPFKLTVDGDRLYGRGVTDCLGHVAVLTTWFKQLAIARPALRAGVAAVFIANEETSAVEGVGIDMLAKHGELEFTRSGPLYWVDTADSCTRGPTIGTASSLTWRMTATGKLFHSGLPHMGINAISLATEAIRYVQRRFYADYGMGDLEAKYKFDVGSSLKPTQVSCPPGSNNQIPRQCTMTGDVRMTPFYPTADVRARIESYVKELNDRLIPNARLQTFGYDNFVLPTGGDNGSAIRGDIQWEWLGHGLPGVAVDLDSLGFKAVCDAIHKVTGSVKPYSLTGSLPIIASLKDAGFDVQLIGFGRMDAYHAVNEYGMLSEFKQGARIVSNIVSLLERVL